MAAATRPRVVFVNRFYHPDLSATSQMLSDLTQRLARERVDVHVVCSRQLYENPAARLSARESIAGVQVHRVWTARFGRNRLLGRALDYASFYIIATLKLLWLVRRGDILIMKTDPPLLSIPGALVAALRGASLVNWLQDVFPEVALRLGVARLPGWLEAALCAVRNRSLNVARMNVVLGHRMRDFLLSCRIQPQRLRVVDNWADGDAIRPKPKARSVLATSRALHERFVVAYAGNLGRAHDFQTITDAARRLLGEPEIMFLMIGGGSGMQVLRELSVTRELTNLSFLRYLPREQLGDGLAAADVHLTCLLPQLEGLIVPSKVYGILAAGRPTIFVGDAHGQTATLIREAGCGTTVACGDGQGLADAIRSLRDDRELARSMGERARAAFDSRYSLDRAVEQWLELLRPMGVRTGGSVVQPVPKAPRTVSDYPGT
jgi:colanic acid biosynthesis glycosyl transferase WcaI